MNKYVLIKEEVSVVSKEEDGKRGSGGKRERGEKEFAWGGAGKIRQVNLTSNLFQIVGVTLWYETIQDREKLQSE